METVIKKFLFEVPDGLDIECGETVLCDTIYGNNKGLIVTNPFELERGAAHILSDVLGFYFPVKKIVGVLILPDKSEENGAPFLEEAIEKLNLEITKWVLHFEGTDILVFYFRNDRVLRRLPP